MSDKEDQTPSTSFKISMSSVVESDRVLFNIESKKFYKIILFLIIADFILTELVFIHDYIVKSYIDDKTEKSLKKFFIFSSIALLFFILLLIFLYIKKSIISKIARFSYLSIGLIFFIYQVVIKMIELNDKEFDMGAFDYILFIVLALSIIPRITGFLYIRIFERTLKKLEDATLTEDREAFIEKVADNFDRSTISNKLLDKEIEKELEKDEEEIIFKINNEKILENKTENKQNIKKDEDKEEIADMD